MSLSIKALKLVFYALFTYFIIFFSLWFYVGTYLENGIEIKLAQHEVSEHYYADYKDHRLSNAVRISYFNTTKRYRLDFIRACDGVISAIRFFETKLKIKIIFGIHPLTNYRNLTRGRSPPFLS